MWQCQSALLSSASEVEVGWRAAAAAAAAAGNNPPVIEIYILKHFLNSWLHNHFFAFSSIASLQQKNNVTAHTQILKTLKKP